MMTRYEWRDARPEDVGKTFPDAKFSDIGDWSIAGRGKTELRGQPGAWRAWHGGGWWKYAQVLAPVDDDQTQEFDFADSQRLEYEKAAMVALLSNPAICHGDPTGNRSTYLGQAETKPWLVSQAMQIARLMMEARK